MTLYIRPWATANVDDQATVDVSGGQIVLDSFGIPYGTAQVQVPLTTDLDLDDLDPRDDVRVVLSAGNTGHWEDVDAVYGPWEIEETNRITTPSFEVGAPVGGEQSSEWAMDGSFSLFVPPPAVTIPYPSPALYPATTLFPDGA